MTDYLAETRQKIGQRRIGAGWILIDQTRIDRFAVATDDPDPMHIDPEWCEKNSPYGGTIAFGFLTMSLLSALGHQIEVWPGGAHALNYGFDRVRLLTPVPVNSRVRGCFTLTAIEPKGPGRFLFRTDVEVEVESQDKPALVAEWLWMLIFDGPL